MGLSIQPGQPPAPQLEKKTDRLGNLWQIHRVSSPMPHQPPIQIRLDFRTLSVFLFFFFTMHELHELAHIFTGRLICGCWGTRDFNVWDLCPDCLQRHPLSILATLAGPVFTFIMLWAGWYLLKHGKSTAHRSWGLVFIFGNMPFGRIYMAATGSGDEVWAIRHLFLNPDHSNATVITIATSLLVTLICLPPLITAYKAMASKRKGLIFAGLLIVPLILDTVIILTLLNGLLSKGVLGKIWIMGTPLLITCWLLVCGIIVGTNLNRLTHFGKVPDAQT